MRYIIFSLFVFFVAFRPSHALVADLKTVDSSGNEKTSFSTDESVYLQGECALVENNLTKIIITKDKTSWTGGEQLSDVSGGIETLDQDASSTINKRLIWPSPINEGYYDVVLDTNNNYKHESFEICIVGLSGVGFTVGNPAPTPAPAPTPTPAPTPAPAPTPQPKIIIQKTEAPKPSKTFSLGEEIEVRSLSNVRDSAGGNLTGQQLAGFKGRVVGGPVYSELGGTGYWFWNVDYDIDPDGWTAEKTLKTAEVSEPEPEVEIEPVAIIEEDSEPPTKILDESATENKESDEETDELAAVSEGPQVNVDVLGGVWGAGLIALSIIAAAWVLGRGSRKRVE